MPEHRLNVTIVQAGRVAGTYSYDGDALMLQKIAYPEEDLPFDVGVVATTLTPMGEPLTALVLGPISQPVNTRVDARLLGGARRVDGEPPVLVAVPNADKHAPQSLMELGVGKCDEILSILKESRPGHWSWLTVDQCEPALHAASKAYRKQREASARLDEVTPDWKPIWLRRPSASFTEAERYTAAEYTFYDLPNHFQHYVTEFLAANERILFAAQRPRMPSSCQRSWLRRTQLQAGVLILTDQRLIQLSELMPPDSANVRYGFHTSVGVLERLEEAATLPLGSEALLLRTRWNARGGSSVMEWEMPAYTRPELNEILRLVRGFAANDPAACRLRRATPPVAPEKLPLLEDTAASDPKVMLPVNEHFRKALADCLPAGEEPRAWAYLPEWFDRKSGGQAVVVTQYRLLRLPDCGVSIGLECISTLEYTGSILDSSILIHYFDGNAAVQRRIGFPYPAQNVFRTCFEAVRRCMAVAPLPAAGTHYELKGLKPDSEEHSQS